jgi:hypothetical protein
MYVCVRAYLTPSPPTHTTINIQNVQGLERQKLTMEKELAGMLTRQCTEEEVDAYLKEFTRCYADYGEQRRKEVGVLVGGVWMGKGAVLSVD